MQKTLKHSKVVIFADSREPEEVFRELSNYDCIVKRKMLHVADYILSEAAAVERKTYSDFLRSIIDKRLFEQLSRLSKEFKKPVLIIEGSRREDISIHKNAVRGALAAVALDYGVPVIWARDVEDTAGIIFWMAKREQAESGREVSVRGKRRARSMEEQQEFLVSGLPNVNTVIAKRLLKHFKTPRSVFSAPEAELKKVKSIGKKKAGNILKLLGSEYKES